MSATSLSSTTKDLDVDKTLSFFCHKGPLSRRIRNYEARSQQLDMARDVIDAYNQHSISLIEAGTGTGKSMAYLIPAIEWALKNGQCTVISTNTINLQEQLIFKDIPLLREALGVEVKAVLVKGMGNYLCKRKLETVSSEFSYFPEEEQKTFNVISAWAEKTYDGSKSSLPIMPSGDLWDKVCAESDACTGKRCEAYEDCFFFKARRRAANAHILVVNHHLFFADLALRVEEGKPDMHAILPPYHRLVLDEAHNIEDVATEYFASRVSHQRLAHTLSKLSSERQVNVPGKLYQLRELLNKIFPEDSRDSTKQVNHLLTCLELDLVAERARIFEHMRQVFHQISAFQHIVVKLETTQESRKLRMRAAHFNHPYWLSEVAPKITALIEALKRYIQSLMGLEKAFEDIEHPVLMERSKDLLIDVKALAMKLSHMMTDLKTFAFAKDDIQQVRWMVFSPKKGVDEISLVCAHLSISEILSEQLFKRFFTVILCSATLSTNKHFKFIRERLGIKSESLPGRQIIESIYSSPFDYAKQALIVIPKDLPEPQNPQFIQLASEKIWDALEAAHGNAFILFTSFRMLKKCYDILKVRLRRSKYFLFKQGDANRRDLLEQFVQANRAVLFGTDSFWEGVDVVGENLRCVIIVKLPFQVPSEPMIQARTEAIMSEGGNPFMEYSVPTAIVKFKQGFGRLIRNKKDRGCMVCLDSRILNKAYGKQFLNSLPFCQNLFLERDLFFKEMEKFYKRTYFLITKDS